MDTSAPGCVGEPEAAILLDALLAKDPHALFEAVTKAVGGDRLCHLDAALGVLRVPEAKFKLIHAETLYRAFEDGIKTADPDAALELGRA